MNLILFYLSPFLSLKESLMHSQNLAFYSLNFIWEINTNLAFLLFQAFKTGIWLPGNDNGFQICGHHIDLCEMDSASWKWVTWSSWDPHLLVWFLWGRLSKIEPSDVMHTPDCYENSIDDFNETHYLFITICVSFSLMGDWVNWLKFSADRVFDSVL